MDSKINKLPNMTVKLENTTMPELIKLVHDYVATKRITKNPDEDAYLKTSDVFGKMIQ